MLPSLMQMNGKTAGSQERPQGRHCCKLGCKVEWRRVSSVVYTTAIHRIGSVTALERIRVSCGGSRFRIWNLEQRVEIMAHNPLHIWVCHCRE